MTEIIVVLRQEYRNIEKLLRVLERELSVFDRGDHPDYEVIVAVVDYFKDYPDRCHHPKEDMIVEKFKASDPVAAATIGDLEAEHREGAKRLRRVAQALESILSDQDLLRQTVDDIIRDFIMRPDDWADIALQLADHYGPLSQPDFEEKFSTLRRNILEMEEEAEAEVKAIDRPVATVIPERNRSLALRPDLPQRDRPTAQSTPAKDLGLPG